MIDYFVPSSTFFKCRICEALSDDGDFKNQVCLRCIDELVQHRTHELNKNLDFKKAAEKAKKRGKV